MASELRSTVRHRRHGSSIDWLPDGRILLGSTSLDQFFALGEDSAEVVAGVGAEGASSGGGPAAQARLRAPQSVAALASGEIFIADEERVRVVRPDGVIEAADVTRPEAYLACGFDGWSLRGGAEELLYRSPGGAAKTVALAADCPDCQGAASCSLQDLMLSAESRGRSDGVWSARASRTGYRLARVTDDGEFVTTELPVMPFAFRSLTRSMAASERIFGAMRSSPPEGDCTRSDRSRTGGQEIPGSAGLYRRRGPLATHGGRRSLLHTGKQCDAADAPEGTLNTVAELEAPAALALTAGATCSSPTQARAKYGVRSPTECDRTVRPQIYSSGVFNAAGRRSFAQISSTGAWAGSLSPLRVSRTLDRPSLPA
ncbi:MAG: hypothetical protein R2724_18075 [Bryobacterales bacterium]